MRLRLLFTALSLLTLGACLEGLEPPNGRFGLITVETYGPDDPNYSVFPVAVFLGQTNRSFGTFPADSCGVFIYNPNGQGFGFLTTLGAGDAIGMTLSGQVRSLKPDTAGSIVSYFFDGVSTLSFTPGDTLSLTVPGATPGFPAANIKVRTAEPFTHSVVPVSADGEDIVITWDAAAEPGSLMSFSLQYSNSSGSGTFANEHVFCAFTDDGSGTIKSGYLAGWRTSTGDFRNVLATRLRSTTQVLDDRTTLSVVSTFRRPLGSYVAP